jgi:Pyridoxamine 5'-phosphate oxidase
MASIPKVLHEHINTAFSSGNVVLLGTVLPDGYAQITPRGSTMVFDDHHFATWERGRGSTSGHITDGSRVTIFFRKPELRQSGVLPRGGIARFYGVAEIHRSGAIYDQIWERLIQPEKNNDPDKKGFGVLIRVERAEDLAGNALQLD